MHRGPEIIRSKQNEKVKTLVKLREKKLLREAIGQFLIEGFKELHEALNANVKVIEVYYCPNFFQSSEFTELLAKAQKKGAILQEVSQEIFEKIAFREGPDGLLGIGETWSQALEDLQLSDNPLIFVVETVEKPGNLGNMIRSAEAAGADALIICEPLIDIFNPNVVRASRGMVFNLPIGVASNEAVLAFLNKHSIKIVSTTPHADQMYWNADMSSPTAIFVGNERNGLSDFWLKNQNVQKVKIPLNGKGDSLNAATAGVIVLYEALRQRAVKLQSILGLS